MSERFSGNHIRRHEGALFPHMRTGRRRQALPLRIAHLPDTVRERGDIVPVHNGEHECPPVSPERSRREINRLLWRRLRLQMPLLIPPLKTLPDSLRSDRVLSRKGKRLRLVSPVCLVDRLRNHPLSKRKILPEKSLRSFLTLSGSHD